MEEQNVTSIAVDPIGDARKAEEQREERRRFFEYRSMMVQAWEDLTAAGIEAKLEYDPDKTSPRRRFQIDVKSGSLGDVHEIVGKRGLEGSLSTFGAKIRLKEEE